MRLVRDVVAVGLVYAVPFLASLGCRMNESDAKTKSVRTMNPSGPGHAAGGTEVAQLGASQAPPRVAVAGGRLSLLQTASQTLFHLSEHTAGRTLPIKDPRGVAAFPDGRILVLSEAEPGRHVVQVLSPQGTTQSYSLLLPLAPLRDRRFRMQADPQATDEFVVIGERGAIGYKLELLGDHLRRRYSHDLTPGEAATATLAQDGSLWFYRAPGLGKLVRGSDAPQAVPVPQLQEPIWHLSPGPTPQMLWASVGTHRLVRLTVGEGGARMEQTLDATPAVIHTLASAGGQVAALLLTESAGQPAHATVVAYDAQGTQLLRQEVPGPFDAREAWSVALSPAGHLAVASATRLRVFELSTHKLILRHGDAIPHVD